MRLPTEIRTARLILRRPRLGDAEAVLAGIANWNVIRMLGPPPWPYLREHAVEYLGVVSIARDDRLDLAITREDDTLIGMIGLGPREGPMFVGYWLAEAHWGCGIMSEALIGVCAHGFAAMGCERIVSGVFADNPASLRVQEKVGFVRTGRSMIYCVPRGHDVARIDTVLTPQFFADATRR